MEDKKPKNPAASRAMESLFLSVLYEKKPGGFVLVILIALFLIFGLITIPVYLFDISDKILPWLTTIVGKIVGAIILLGIGIVLYLFKKREQFWYGIIEIGAALVSCYLAFGTIEKAVIEGKENMELATYVAIASTLYVVVRGVENMMKGFESGNFFGKKYFPTFKSIITGIFIYAALLLAAGFGYYLLTHYLSENIRAVLGALFIGLVFVFEIMGSYYKRKRRKAKQKEV